jgi:ABC-type lipoprotein release transport system permease subunit
MTFFATRLLHTLVFEVDVLDPILLLCASLAILLIAVLASLLPALRAAAVEPMTALRAE